MTAETKLPSKLYTDLIYIDSLWQKRKRKITTASVLAALCASSLNKRGIRHILHADNSNFTPQALQKARGKIPQHAFLDVNRSLQSEDLTKPCIYAIDGSKVHVHPSFAKFGFKSRTNDQPVRRQAKKPMCMQAAARLINA